MTDLLQQAKKDPALRPEFYKTLWEAELFFIGQIDKTDDTYHLSFYEAGGKTLLPCYSSEELLRSVVPEHEPKLLLPVREVFPNIGSEITVVLNPFTEPSKEFDSLERRALADGVLFDPPEP
ncbi:SseB family protein [Tumebacillus amylolyticus]|uniref:SseB family protein n=1 Tax=Tumebacillus amylolyticus TaxID=2801339 RepID=UPI003221D440